MTTEYTLLVVDDEQHARAHLLRDIAWHKLSVTTLYEAADGREALALIEERRPDMMIVDVRMPGMDGVALVDAVHQRQIEMQIIALSGYSDFEAARRMMASGRVVEYLLKPASEDVIFEAVYKCITNIDEKKRIEELRQNLTRAESAVRRIAIQACLFGNDAEEDGGAYLQPNQAAQVAIVHCENPEAVRDFCRPYRTSPSSVLEHCFDTAHPNRKALVFSGRTPSAFAGVEGECGEIASACGGWAGIGRIYPSEHFLNISFQEALLACVSRVFFPDRQVLHIEDAERWMTSDAEDVSPAELSRLLERGELSRLEETTASLLGAILRNQKDRLFQFSQGRVDLSGIAIYFANLVDAAILDRKEELNISAILEAKDFDNLLHVVNSTFAQYYDSHHSEGGGHKAALVREVKEYIQAHYAEHITLASAAQVVYINATYLSKLFAEVEGIGFSDYIARVRVEKAKELLANRRLKIYEIADMVGYHNVKHFLRVFKKQEGMTPSEYKEKHCYP